uniref:Aspartate aminotransferase n=1 Tax=Klebsiella pneumoniae TaxID=573 RepID=A0A5P1PHY1_KLEPN|nr:hypothetical protein [Klebsiella pneumoniae]QEQ68971.1 Aspartate aminotransferase [Klebsiella pneumoniae]
MGEISLKTGDNALNGGKNSLNRLIRCVCGKKIGPDPRNFNQRVSLGRNDLLIRTFPYSAYSQLQRIENRLFFVLAEAERGLHRRIYIADNLKSDNGEFIIDKLLGSSHLQVQSAVDVFEVILPKSLSEGPLPVIKSSGEIYRIHHWFDICPKGAEANISLSNIEAPVNKVTRHSFDSREAAIMHILMQKETVKKSVSGDRSNTPEGVVERWY